jgi:hypothetical protein
MEYLQFGSIKRVVLPGDWIALPERNTAIMTLRSCHPRAHDDVEITFLRRRQEVVKPAMDCFRSTLAQPLHRITAPSEEIIAIAGAMGNAGDNQWTNKKRGEPSFRLVSAETIQLKDRKVLLAKGSFIDPKTRKTINEYCGIFVNASADKRVVEEVFLLVPSLYGYFQFEQYARIFTETISSIDWI